MALERARKLRGFSAGRFVATLAGVLFAFAVAAGPGPEASAEIDRLLAFIRDSTCGFVRNGREYRSERAYRHVRRKFDYFFEQIESAEDFIELAATRSTQSGRPYEFVCNGEARESSAVLHEALQRLRAESGG